MDATFEQIQALPIAERLKLVARIWDGISESEEPLLLQDWHKELARERSAELDADPTIAITRDELWKRVDRDDG
jgi:putative addiction module component (TIGR02574 family)